MEAVIVQLINALLASVPAIIRAVESSTSIDTEEKKTILADLDLRLLEARDKVQRVRFKSFTGPVVVYPPTEGPETDK